MTTPGSAFARLSLRSRIALLAAAAVGLAVAIASFAAYVTVRNQLYSSRDANLIVRANAAVGSLLAVPERLIEVPAAALGAADVRLGLIRADGEWYVAAGGEVPPFGQAERQVARGELARSIRTADSQGTEFRVVTVPVSPGLALVLAQPTHDAEQLLDRLGLVLFLVGALGMVVAATAGLAIARAALRPVADLTAGAERVASAPDRLEPIEVRGHDELARLATSFNAMLAALAASRQRQQQLVADAGHELRTPLTSLRTNLDLLAQDDASQVRRLGPGERKELLADVRAQVEELSGLVQDVIELARDDPPGAQVEPLDFADVCERAVDRVRRRGTDLTLDVRLEPWPAYGDATALERAVTNILDNAAKWSPPGGVVTVRLQDGELRVSDQGPGISEADLPHVFDRFYRSSAARQLPGSGLGLAIVRQVADRHGATATAQAADDGGTLVLFRLPADDRPPAERPAAAPHA